MVEELWNMDIKGNMISDEAHFIHNILITF